MMTKLMTHFINPANCDPGVHTGPAPGRHGKNIKKNRLRNHMAQSFHMLCGPIYNTLLYYAANGAPGVHTGHAPGMSLSTIDL